MKVLIVNNAVPFIWGGAEELAVNLDQQLNALKGVESEILRIPFAWEPKERIASEIILNSNLGIVNADRVIALKFPAYLVQHDRKTIWLLHQFRQAYDLLDAGRSLLARGQDDGIIGAVTRADNACFDAAQWVFANSPVTRDRLQRYNGRKSEVLYPPLNDPDLFEPGPYGDYIFAGGRVGESKRQHLLVEAARLAGNDCRLVVAGPPGSQADADLLRELVGKYGLQDRVTLQLRMHSRKEIGDLARHALACAYIPFDEDSLGYVTMEAAESGRAIVTTTDSGGLLEIVKDLESGFVCAPDAASLATAFDRLFADRALARRLGAAARDLWTSKKIDWPTTLERLLA
jgi:glycosyltransferase involved in cell wall biosynthesis